MNHLMNDTFSLRSSVMNRTKNIIMSLYSAKYVFPLCILLKKNKITHKIGTGTTNTYIYEILLSCTITDDI